MTVNNGIAIINSVMTTLADVDPPTIAPIEGVLVLVPVGLVVAVLIVIVELVIEVDPWLAVVYTSVHSGPVVPVGGNTRFLPTLIYICIY